MVSLKWHDALAQAGRLFSAAERAAGWPQTMTIAQLAALQRPAATRAALQYALQAACQCGDLPHTTTTKPVTVSPARLVNTLRKAELFGGHARVVYTQPARYSDVTEYLIAAPAFAAWLAAAGETPSPHIAAWFEATQPEAAPVPTDEPIKDRNDRWLAFYEAEEKAGRKYGAVGRGAKHFQAERSLYGKALKDAKALRAKKCRDDIKAVPAKGGAEGPWLSTLVEMGKKTKGKKT